MKVVKIFIEIVERKTAAVETIVGRIIAVIEFTIILKAIRTKKIRKNIGKKIGTEPGPDYQTQDSRENAHGLDSIHSQNGGVKW